MLKALPLEERANPSINLDLSQLPISRALGLHWDTASDTLQFKVVPTNKPPTKRFILSTVSSLFDPLGFLGPFLLPDKVILQELWRMDVQWDDPIPEPLLTQWNGWVESLPLVANIKIPRCFKSFSSTRVITDVQMHYFSDAILASRSLVVSLCYGKDPQFPAETVVHTAFRVTVSSGSYTLASTDTRRA